MSGDAPLEARLRGLILTNANSGPPENPGPDGPDPPPTAEQASAQSQAQASRKGGKKRPNQAERRQMSAQLTIPIDTRPRPAPSFTRDAANQQAGRRYQQPQNPFQGHQQQDSFLKHQQRNSFQKHQQQNSFPEGSQQHAFQRQPGPYHGGFQHQPPSPHHPSSTSAHPDSSLRHPRSGFGPAPPSADAQRMDWRRQQQPPGFDRFSKGVNVVSADSFSPRGPRPPPSNLYQPTGHRNVYFNPEQIANQVNLLHRLSEHVVPGAEIGPAEIAEKDAFRVHVQSICRDAVSQHELETNSALAFQPLSVQLKCFGSLASGFATKAADMDLGLISPMSQVSPDAADSPIPRLIEKALLDAGFGARLLTRTRVPIIKLCEKPNDSLRRGLVEARTKWERGLKDEGHDEEEEDEEIPEGHDVPREDPPALDDNAQPSDATRRGSKHAVDNSITQTYEAKLASLKQGQTQSFALYQNNAKRLLRRLNGRDITHSSLATFKESDWKLLDDVTGAFIQGLRNEELRNRILQYPSFSKSTMPSAPNRRSLAGARTLVEGEKLVMLFEEAQSNAGPTNFDRGYEKHVQYWKDLQRRKSFGSDPLVFNKELQFAADALRQIPSIQLRHFQQEQHEAAVDYHARAIKIAQTLARAQPTQPSPEATALVIKSYIGGIRDQGQRAAVQAFVDSTGIASLRTIARKHKCLGLAADYERAIEKSLFREEDVPIITAYVAVLRHDFTRCSLVPGDPFDFVNAVTPRTSGLLEHIQKLPNPANLSPNQPRDRYHDSLEFPKAGVGVQCDINFSAHLALQNTLLLRCYSLTDPRVRPMVLFVKHWAKSRGINTPYRGTLSSYGYVLMVLHYLVNVAEPFVCPNLQLLAPPHPDLPADALEGITTCKGRDIRFWRDEEEIQNLAAQGQLNQNRDSVGHLLRGFFEYYAQGNLMSTVQKRGFDWGREVLSLRTPGGLLMKSSKGWTGAKTVKQPQTGSLANPGEPESTVTEETRIGSLKTGDTPEQGPPQQRMSTDNVGPAPTEQQATKPQEFKEVRLRYLFAIEDPFEHEHNVARTVTHNGIVSIRDEFRRAWRIIRSAGRSGQVSEDLLEDVKLHNEQAEQEMFAGLLQEIHGPHILPE
ncbi:hypothetical protein F4780DRAFT_124193 [Xylariomycetidae sp. FL0641]|nr:hypothetical protein F4780DRAFT_124193 [Xylariomycetidae sp. FL0641]